jgi:hypothetical protein
VYSVWNVDAPLRETEYTRDAYATVLGDFHALVDKASLNFFILSVEGGARINCAVAGEAEITVGFGKQRSIEFQSISGLDAATPPAISIRKGQ